MSIFVENKLLKLPLTFLGTYQNRSSIFWINIITQLEVGALVKRLLNLLIHRNHNCRFHSSQAPKGLDLHNWFILLLLWSELWANQSNCPWNRIQHPLFRDAGWTHEPRTGTGVSGETVSSNGDARINLQGTSKAPVGNWWRFLGLNNLCLQQ